MRRLLAAISVILGLSAVPASAAVIFSESGTVPWNWVSGDVESGEEWYVGLGWAYDIPILAPWGPFPDYKLPTPTTFRFVYTGPTPYAFGAYTFPGYEYDEWKFVNGSWQKIWSEGDFYRLNGNSGCAYGGCPPGGLMVGNQVIWQVTFPDYHTVSNDGLYGAVWTSWVSAIDMGVTLPNSTIGLPYQFQIFAFSAVPEPSTWAMLILGFGACGAALRRRRRLGLRTLAG